MRRTGVARQPRGQSNCWEWSPEGRPAVVGREGVRLFHRGNFDEDQPHRGLSGRFAARRGQLQLVRRQVGHRLRQHRRRVETDDGPHRLRRGLSRSARSICPPTPTASAPASPSSARTCSARTPLQLGKLNRRMDAALKGHAYVKSAHRHGLLGHSGQGGGLPVCIAAGRPLRRRLRALPRHLAGVARGDGRPRSPATGPRAIGGSSSRSAAIRRRTSPASAPWRAELQPGDRLIADANTGWLMHDAMRVVRAVRDVDVYIEQPCLSYEECLSIRRHTDHPFVLDEVIDSASTCCCAARPTGAMDVVNIKISKLGGLTQGAAGARSVRVAGRRHDAGGQLGRRHRHGRHRAPGPQHAAGVPVHGRPTSTATSR